MRFLTRISPLLIALLALAALPVVAQHAPRRVAGKVVDDKGQPVAGAHIVTTSPQTAVKIQTDTNDKGEFTVMVASGAANDFTVTATKEGFSTGEKDFTVLPGDTARGEIILKDLARLAAEAEARHAASAEGRAVDLHNAGVEASNARDWALAKTKFDEALVLREASASTHSAAATAAWNLKEYAATERHARRALELEPDQEYTINLLANALLELGKTDEAEALQKTLAAADPKLRAELAYSRGADLGNAGKDAEALAAFEEALAADPDLIAAHYAAGLTAFRLGNLPRAKVALTRYLELEPEGNNAKTATALLGTIK